MGDNRSRDPAGIADPWGLPGGADPARGQGAGSHPGPFLPRTIEFGRCIGLRHEGQLIAMAQDANGYDKRLYKNYVKKLEAAWSKTVFKRS